jgi:holliday junction DNA helicase RuvA
MHSAGGQNKKPNTFNMIAFIRGTLIDKSPTHVIIETNGVGFDLLIPVSTFERLAQPGAEVQMLTHLYVREDALVLYGFSSVEERELFRELLTVSGIGPRLALTILSGSPVNQIYRAIADGDEVTLTKIKGLGKKTVQRLILDLKERASEKIKQTSPEPAFLVSEKGGTVEQSIAAMISLGYSRREAEAVIARAAARSGRDASVEELIRIALSAE